MLKLFLCVLPKTTGPVVKPLASKCGLGCRDPSAILLLETREGDPDGYVFHHVVESSEADVQADEISPLAVSTRVRTSKHSRRLPDRRRGDIQNRCGPVRRHSPLNP